MRRKNTEKLNEILGQVLKQNHLDEKLYETRVIKSWQAVLGDTIMQYTTNLYFDKKKLYVSLSSSALRQELFMMQEEVKKSLNKHVGAEVVKEIIFR